VARDEPALESLVRRWVVPRALFAGAVFGFVACCVAGWIASGRDLYVDFVRSHMFIGLETSFRPTVSQLRARVAHATSSGQVIVVVGGSSVFNGVSQGPDTIWTRRLQEQLGARFRVFNFAFRAGAHTEAGGLVAESFIKEGRPVIYVADAAPASAVPPLAGFHEYLFWDAYYKDRLLEDPARDARIDQLSQELPARRGDSRDQLRLGGRFDSRLYFNDLWTTVGYRWFFTVWTQFTRDRPFAPRKTFTDPDHGVSWPFEQRYLPAQLELSLRIVRGFAEGRTIQDRHGRWVADRDLPAWQAYRRAIELDLPRRLRERTVLVLDGQSPYYLDMLTPEERLRYDLVVARSVSVAREAAFEAVAIGPGFTVADFHDRVHLTIAGGTKLAGDLAPIIRALAERLGYLR
jgi:hypothetical protein